MLAERIGAEHYGTERLETSEVKAERILREELRSRRWKEGDLAKRGKGDLGKVKIAARLREETLVTVKWIAARLWMGHGGLCEQPVVSVAQRNAGMSASVINTKNRHLHRFGVGVANTSTADATVTYTGTEVSVTAP